MLDGQAPTTPKNKKMLTCQVNVKGTLAGIPRYWLIDGR